MMTKAGWLGALLGLGLFGCGVATEADDVDAPEDVADDSADLSSTKDTFAVVRRDMRKCISPLCGGYWLKDLNSTMQDRYVSGFDFEPSVLSDEDQGDVVGAPDLEVVVFGRLGAKEKQFGTRPFIVKEAYRALPGNTVATTDKYYGVYPTKIACIKEPCANLQATRLNRATGHAMATEVDVSRALKQLVSVDWVKGRVLQSRAIVAGSIVRSAGGHVVVDASQVYIQLPDRIQSCPKVAPPSCSNGKVEAWSMNANRCMVPAGCTAPGVCALYIPSCAPGYSQLSWQNVCPRYACQPEWLD